MAGHFFLPITKGVCVVVTTLRNIESDLGAPAMLLPKSIVIACTVLNVRMPVGVLIGENCSHNGDGMMNKANQLLYTDFTTGQNVHVPLLSLY